MSMIDFLFYVFALINMQFGVSLPKTAKYSVVAQQLALLHHSSRV